MKKYLIIGGTGSLGRKLIERLLPNAAVAVYSRDEAKHWTIRNEIVSRGSLNSYDLQFFVGDIRDKARIKDVLRKYSSPGDELCVIVAAALKQVDTCELSPEESVKTNVIGTQNVIDAVIESWPHVNVKSVLFVSTDKACSPVNVYGMCKAVSERMVSSQTFHNTKFLVVRYGNVLESRGSIVPLFKYQCMHSKTLTVTDPDMTRFLMTLDDSVDLILDTLEFGNSGETWIPILSSMRVGDLAEIFSEIYNKPIDVIGTRPGEKMHEDLINAAESVRTIDVNACSKRNYVIKPAYTSGSRKVFTYSSNHSVLSKEDLRSYLKKVGVLDMELDQFKGRSIEEIVT